LDRETKGYLIDIIGTIIIFALIFYFFDFKKVFEIIFHSDYYYIVAAIFTYVGVVILMSTRIKIVLDKLNYNIPVLSIIKSNLAGMIASDFTPARSGYFFTSFSLTSKDKVPIHDSLLTIFGPQLFDFIIKAVSLVIILLLIFNNVPGLHNNLLLVLVSVLGIFGVIGFLGALLFVPRLLKKFSFMKQIPFGKWFYSLFSMMGENAHKLLKIKGKIVLITVVSWMFKGLEWFLVSRALGITIFDGGILQYLFIMIFQASITLIQFLPLPTIAGGGASEFGFSGVLFLFGISIEAGIAFALITRMTMIIIDIFGIGEVISYIQKEGLSGFLKELGNIGHGG